jgi:hypothetical protein
VGNRIEWLKSRKGFYRDNYSRVCMALLSVLFVIFLVSGIVIYLTIYLPTPDFFASTDDGRLTRLVSLGSADYSYKAP